MSQKFTKVPPGLWTGEVARAVRGDGASFALMGYLYSSEHSTPTGVFRLPLPYIHEDLGFELDTIRAAMAKLEAAGFCEYDAGRRAVWVCDKAEHVWGGISGADNNAVFGARALVRALEEFGDCAFTERFRGRYTDLYESLRESALARVAKAKADGKNSKKPNIPEALRSPPKPLASPSKPLASPSKPLASPPTTPSNEETKPFEALGKPSEGVSRARSRSRSRGRDPDSESTIVDSGGDPPPKRHAQKERIGRVIEAATDRGAILPNDAGGAIAGSWREFRKVYGDNPAVDEMVSVAGSLDFESLEPQPGPQLRYLLGALGKHLDERKGRKRPGGRHPPAKLSPGWNAETKAMFDELEGGGA